MKPSPSIKLAAWRTHQLASQEPPALRVLGTFPWLKSSKAYMGCVVQAVIRSYAYNNTTEIRSLSFSKGNVKWFYERGILGGGMKISCNDKTEAVAFIADFDLSSLLLLTYLFSCLHRPSPYVTEQNKTKALKQDITLTLWSVVLYLSPLTRNYLAIEYRYVLTQIMFCKGFAECGWCLIVHHGN